jgi:dTDP-4-amino-4,6-dideoxygalactose transaminase
VFVDIDPTTYTLDLAATERAITPRTRAIVAVHLYGHPAAMDRLVALARAHGLAVIEDAAQAIGARWADRAVGAWGDAACLSFYPTKNLGGCGDGGMILTNRDDVAERARRLRHHGDAGRYEHAELGYAGSPLTLPEEREGARHVYYLYTVRHPQRDALAKVLADLGVGTAVHYPVPVPAQPMFGADGERRWPEAWRAAREVLSLPCFAELTDDEVEEVARLVKRACESV